MTVSEQIIQVLDHLGEKFGLAIDWTGENIVPYVATLGEKLVTYGIWSSVASIAFVLFLCIISAICIKVLRPIFIKKIAAQSKYEDGWSIGAAFAIAALTILYLATIIVIGVNVSNIVKCITFPEMYIFEYIQAFINWNC